MDIETRRAFEFSAARLEAGYIRVLKELRQKAFFISATITTINVVSLVSGAGSLVTVGRGVISKLITKGALNPSGKFYSVAHQVKLPNNLYPGGSYYQHFSAANKSLIASLDDASFKFLNIEFQTSKTGAILWGRSPKNWVWHHDIQTGIMQLVPKVQHTIGSIFWKALHPKGFGGMKLWN